MFIDKEHHTEIFIGDQDLHGAIPFNFPTVEYKRKSPVKDRLPCHAIQTVIRYLITVPRKDIHVNHALVHLFDNRFGKQSFSLIQTFIQMHLQPFQHFIHAGIDGCCRCTDIHFPSRHLRHFFFSVPLKIADGKIVILSHIRNSQTASVHTKRLKNTLLHQFFPGLSGDTLCNMSKQGIDHIAVLCCAPKRLVRL